MLHAKQAGLDYIVKDSEYAVESLNAGLIQKHYFVIINLIMMIVS